MNTKTKKPIKKNSQNHKTENPNAPLFTCTITSRYMIVHVIWKHLQKSLWW